ncbi:MAG: erythromycin esterase family protein [Ignavibacteriales bacterium]|nr:erythromycin esterase family protein [Ignavibacteriales bacterium]
MKNLIFLFLFLTFFSCNIQAQVFLNLDFENYSSLGNAKGWYQGGEGYKVFVDTSVFFTGKGSMCIEKNAEGSFGVASTVIKTEDAKGKTVCYTGYIKSEVVTTGFAGLWWRVDGKNGILNFDNMQNRGVKGTTGWQKYSIELKIDENPENIVFGVLLVGDGKAWFDNLQIELDGKVYEQIPPKVFSLTGEQIDWLQSNTCTFNSADPKQDNSDLHFLKEIVGNAKIVSLGEGTHGTSEFFKMKHRITKYLAEELGFTVFAIEANMPEAKAVNDYILYGKGNAKEALAGLYFWTWNTQEVLDMIEWMREFNMSKKGRIEFWGFDMQTPDIAVANVLNFLASYDSANVQQVKSNYDSVLVFYAAQKKSKVIADKKLYEPVLSYAAEVLSFMEKKEKLFKESVDKDSVDWAIQNARIVVQCITDKIPGGASRDESMAANTGWILKHSGADAKIVLWAHNGHVAKSKYQTGTMGFFLDKTYGKEMVVFGFGFFEGKYTAFGKNGINNYSTSLPQPGSFEWILHNAGKEQLIIDLRKFTNSPFAWLVQDNIGFRSIGAVPVEEAFYPTKIAQDYDAIVYFEKTEPTACFRKKKD